MPVQAGIQRGPFELLDSAELKFLSAKTALLTALTSISEVMFYYVFSFSYCFLHILLFFCTSFLHILLSFAHLIVLHFFLFHCTFYSYFSFSYHMYALVLCYFI